MLLQFNVENQIITRTDSNRVVSDSKNYLFAEFAFSGEWEGIITAVFKNSNTAYNAVLDENNRCEVPWEVIKPGRFSVSCFCGNLITANRAFVPVIASGYEQGETPREPSPDVYSQLVSITGEAIEKGNELYERYLNGELNGKDGKDGRLEFDEFEAALLSRSDFEENGVIAGAEKSFYVAKNDIEVMLKNEVIIISSYDEYADFKKLYTLEDTDEIEALFRRLIYREDDKAVIPKGSMLSIYKKEGSVALRSSQMLLRNSHIPFNDFIYIYLPGIYPILFTGDFVFGSLDKLVEIATENGLHNYSTNEKRIGSWIDGKPLYEKTVVFDFVNGGAAAIDSNTRIFTGIDSPETVMIAEQYFYDNTTGEATSKKLIPMYANQGGHMSAYYDTADGEIALAFDSAGSYPVPNESGLRQLWLVLHYTKATD